MLTETRDQSPGSVLDELLTTEQVAAILQIRRSTVEDYARRGVLPSLKLGRHRRYIRSQIETTIAQLTQSSPIGRRR